MLLRHVISVVRQGKEINKIGETGKAKKYIFSIYRPFLLPDGLSYLIWTLFDSYGEGQVLPGELTLGQA